MFLPTLSKGTYFYARISVAMRSERPAVHCSLFGLLGSTFFVCTDARQDVGLFREILQFSSRRIAVFFSKLLWLRKKDRSFLQQITLITKEGSQFSSANFHWPG